MSTSNPKPYPVGTKLKCIITPHDHDVLSGRGNYVNYHVGNEHFRSLVKKHKIAYVACPKPEKGRFSTIIVDEVRSLDPPGRFLKQDPKTKLWQDIGDKKSLDKTRQALREGAPELLKELVEDDPKLTQSMPEADAQIQSGGAGMFAYAPGGPGSATTAVDGGPQAGSTADQQQIYMQQMQLLSSHAFGGDAAAGGMNLPADQMGLNAFVPAQQQGADPNIPGAPAMFPSSLLDLQGASLDAEAKAERDRLLQQQEVLQQQHKNLLEQQDLLRQLEEQQRAIHEKTLQAAAGGNMSGMAEMDGMAGLTNFPGVANVTGLTGAMTPTMLLNQTLLRQQQEEAAAAPVPENVLSQDEETVPIKPPARSARRRGSLTFDDLVKGIKSAKAAQKMGMSSTDMNISAGDIDSNLSSAFEDSLIISVEGSLANSSNSDAKKPAAFEGGHVASVPEHRASQDNRVPENLLFNQQSSIDPMGESSMLRGMNLSEAGMSFSLADAADVLGVNGNASAMQMSYRDFPESKQDNQDK